MAEDRWFLFVRFWYGFLPAFPFETFDNIVADQELEDCVNTTTLAWADSNKAAVKAYVVELNQSNERERKLRAAKRAGQPEAGKNFGVGGALDGRADTTVPDGALGMREARNQPDLLLDAAGWRRRRRGPIIVLGPDNKIVDPHFSSAHHVMALEGAEVAYAIKAVVGRRIAKCPPMRHHLSGSVVCRVGVIAGSTLGLHQRLDARAQEAALLRRREEAQRVRMTSGKKTTPEEALVIDLMSIAEELLPLVRYELSTTVSSEARGVGMASHSPGNAPSSKDKVGAEALGTDPQADGKPSQEDPLSVPLELNVTDESILNLLERCSPERLVTSDIARIAQFKEKSIGKNLAKLKKAGLIDNLGRSGYSRTSKPRPEPRD